MEQNVLDVDLSFAIDDSRLVGEIQENSRDRDWCANEILDSLAKEEKEEYWEEQRHFYHHIALVALHRCLELQRRMDEFSKDGRDALLNAVVAPVATTTTNPFTDNVPKWMLLDISKTDFLNGIRKLPVDSHIQRALVAAVNSQTNLSHADYEKIFCDPTGIRLMDFTTWCRAVLLGEIDLLKLGDIGPARQKEIAWACWRYLHDPAYRRLVETHPAYASR